MKNKAHSNTLPVHHVKKEILNLINKNRISIITGETGSGKSTQIVQFLYSSGYTKIAITQPRRVGAISLAHRVSEELKVKLGQKVGYVVRFEDVSSRHTQIKYLTDGCLFREYLVDKYLRNYNVIILDEAHERSLTTDILFALTKKLINKRKNLKLIITSATLNVDKFCKYFNCKHFHIPGITYPVEIFNIEGSPKYYMQAAVDTVIQIHKDYPSDGHVLVFLTGRDEIEEACEMLGSRVDDLIDKGMNLPDIVILPAYSTLPIFEQQKIFYQTPKNCRKVVFSTNIAETSLTVPGVKYVIDTGYFKQKNFDEKIGIDSLTVIPISKVAAKQRAGRAGRTCEGKCYRLYSEKTYQSFKEESKPEIQRTSLGGVILLLKSIGISDPLSFDFMDSPNKEMIKEGLKNLFFLNAIDDHGNITKTGKSMTRFPLDPSLSKLLLTAIKYNCIEEMLTITSMLSAESIWIHYTNKNKLLSIKKIHSKFYSSLGDHITYLFVYESWASENFSDNFIEQNHLNYRALHQCKRIREQLSDIVYNFILKNKDETIKNIDPITSCRIVLSSVFYPNTAKYMNKTSHNHVYRPISYSDNISYLYMHPNCVIHDIPNDWIIYDHILYTTKPFMQCVCVIEYDWIKDLINKINNVNIQRLTGKEGIKYRLNQINKEGNTSKKVDVIEVKRKNMESDINLVRERYLRRKKR